MAIFSDGFNCFVFIELLYNAIFYLIEVVKHSRRRYTIEEIERAGRIVGALGRQIDSIFQCKVSETHLQKSSSKDGDYSNDLKKFVRDMSQEDLFSFHPGREHGAFKRFTYDNEVRDLAKFKKRLLKYSSKLDRSREILPDN